MPGWPPSRAIFPMSESPSALVPGPSTWESLPHRRGQVGCCHTARVTTLQGFPVLCLYMRPTLICGMAAVGSHLFLSVRQEYIHLRFLATETFCSPR